MQIQGRYWDEVTMWCGKPHKPTIGDDFYNSFRVILEMVDYWVYGFNAIYHYVVYMCIISLDNKYIYIAIS